MLKDIVRDAIGWAIVIVIVASLAKFFLTMLVYLFH